LRRWRGRGRRSQEAETIARERIEILFEEARRAVEAGRVERAKRYVVLARRIGMRYNVSIPRRFRRWVCSGCGLLLVPGLNCTTRLRPRRFVVGCLACGEVKRIGRTPSKGTARGARA